MLTTPAPCPTPVGCLAPEPCSEVLDAQCIIYTGNDILCDTDVVVNQNDSVATALNQIVDYFCANIPPAPPGPIKGVLPVNIASTQDSAVLASSIVGGTAPFTYLWSFAQNVLKGHTFATSTALSTMKFDLTTDGIRTIAGEALFQSLVKLEVTDVDGNYGSAYYSFSTSVLS
tara:strand:- start:243 stop:761 length:519 start_codon:yes stop_codon:yes gene_type:complete